MHETHCKNNIIKCQCGEKVNVVDIDEHKIKFHQDKTCNYCHKKVQSDFFEKHVHECEHKTVQCQFCGLELNLHDLIEHEETCGGKTEKCEMCSRFIPMKGTNFYNFY